MNNLLTVGIASLTALALALPNPIILEHEQAKLKQLKQKHTAAVRDYQLAVGKLQSAKNQRAYQEYQASLEAARRVEEVNQARSNYERQLAECQQRLGEREFQVAQVKAKLQEVDNALPKALRSRSRPCLWSRVLTMARYGG